MGPMALLLDDGSPKGFFGGQCIVSRAAQSQVGRHVLATAGEGLQVIQLQIACFAAALATLVDVAAAASVARVHCALHSSRDASRTPA